MNTTIDAAVTELMKRHGHSETDERDLAGSIYEFMHEARTEDRLDPEVKAKWVEALRSCDYRQGRRVLRNEDNEYCCLGVLSDIVDPTAWQQDRNNSTSAWCHVMGGTEARTMPSGHVLVAAGASRDILQTTAIRQLAAINDNGAGFALIADLVEEYL